MRQARPTAPRRGRAWRRLAFVAALLAAGAVAAAIAVEEVCRQRPAHSSLEEIVLVAFDSSMAERYQRLLGERPVAR